MGNAVSSPVVVWAKPQPTWILVYSENEKLHLTAIINLIWIFVYRKVHLHPSKNSLFYVNALINTPKIVHGAFGICLDGDRRPC